MTYTRRLTISLAAFLLLLCCSVQAQPSMTAKGLEARLYAPCCYRGTLDGHESELASELRKEIEARLEAGETDRAVEADLVARYGPKIVAVHGESLGAVGVTASIGMLLAGIVLVLAFRRARVAARRDPIEQAVSRPALNTQVNYEARLDAELDRIDF